MSSANAQRVARHHARQKLGLSVLPIPVDAIALAEFLIKAGSLKRADDDRAALATATARLLEIITKEHDE